MVVALVAIATQGRSRRWKGPRGYAWDEEDGEQIPKGSTRTGEVLAGQCAPDKRGPQK